MTPDAESLVPDEIACMECGGPSYRLSQPPPDEPFGPGDVVAYRCRDCMERADVVVPQEDETG